MAYETTDQLMAEFSEHWYKKPNGNLYKLMKTYNDHLEKISDSGEKLMKWRAIQDAEGTTLDMFGKDIETYRPTKDDPPYRFLLRLKYLLSRAQGTIPSIVKITGTALGDFNGIKIWNTDTRRHVGIAMPYDNVFDWPTEKFLLDNLQKMLALGYWLDVIVFYAKTEEELYLGAGTVDRIDRNEKNKGIWWEGWSDTTYNHWFFGTTLYDDWHETMNIRAGLWWKGWSDTSTEKLYVGSQVVQNEKVNLTAI